MYVMTWLENNHMQKYKSDCVEILQDYVDNNGLEGYTVMAYPLGLDVEIWEPIHCASCDFTHN